MSNGLLELPQRIFQKRESNFIPHSDCISSIWAAEKLMQEPFTLVFLSWPASYMTVDTKPPLSNTEKLLRYLRI